MQRCEQMEICTGRCELGNTIAVNPQYTPQSHLRKFDAHTPFWFWCAHTISRMDCFSDAFASFLSLKGLVPMHSNFTLFRFFSSCVPKKQCSVYLVPQHYWSLIEMQLIMNVTKSDVCFVSKSVWCLMTASVKVWSCAGWHCHQSVGTDGRMMVVLFYDQFLRSGPLVDSDHQLHD